MATNIETSKQELLRDLLKQVSRLFYTTLVVVPADVRDQVSLAYLFARAADTIADTELIDRPRRLDLLGQLKAQFVSDQIAWTQVREIQQAVGPIQQNSAERILLERLEDCFKLFQTFSPDDRRRVQRLMTTLTQGMEMDLAVFPGTSAKDLTVLKTLDDLDRYTYYVAGCVGEFWTDLMCAHRKVVGLVEGAGDVGGRREIWKGPPTHEHCERHRARSPERPLLCAGAHAGRSWTHRAGLTGPAEPYTFSTGPEQTCPYGGGASRPRLALRHVDSTIMKLVCDCPACGRFSPPANR